MRRCHCSFGSLCTEFLARLGANTSGGFLESQAKEFLIRQLGRTAKLSDLQRVTVAVNGAALPARFELIVSNPPYIRADDPHLAALRHEPLSALASGADGLDDIRRIAAQAREHLQPGGWLLLEHGWDQAGAVAQLLGEQGYVGIEHRTDLAGHLRCTGGRCAAR